MPTLHKLKPGRRDNKERNGNRRTFERPNPNTILVAKISRKQLIENKNFEYDNSILRLLKNIFQSRFEAV
jgi:hypothetical protein